METKTNIKTKLVGFLLKSILTLGLLVGVFLLWGIFNKVEAATGEFKITSGLLQSEMDQDNPTIASKGDDFVVGWSGYGVRDDNTDVYFQLVHSSGTPIPTYNNQRVDTDNTLVNADNTYLTTLSNGKILMTWWDPRITDQENIYARLFTVDANGDPTFESGPIGNSNMDFRINDDISNFECDTPWVTTDGTNFTIAYYNKNNAAVKVGGDDGTRIKLAFVNSTAFPKDKKTAIAGDYQSSYDAFKVAVVENKTSKLTWKKAIAWVDGTNDKIYLQLYRSDGRKYGSEKTVPIVPGASGLPRGLNLAANNQGKLALTWYTGDKVSNVKSYYSIYNGSSFSTNQITTDPGGQHIAKPQVIANGKYFYLVFVMGIEKEDGDWSNIRLRIYNTSHKVPDPYDLTEDLVRDQDYTPETGGSGGLGGFQFSLLNLPKTGNEDLRIGVQYWENDSGNGISVAEAKFDVDVYQMERTDFVEKEKLISGNYRNLDSTEVSPGKYCLIYAKQYGMSIPPNPPTYIKVFSDSVFASGGAESFPLGDPTSFKGANSKIAADNNGAVGIAYQKDNKIYLRRYDPNLNALGGAMRVDEESTAASRYPSITALNNGDFLVGFSGKYQGSLKYQTQIIPVKAFSSSLTSSTFNPSGAQSRPIGFLSNLVPKAQAQEEMEQFPEGVLEWTEITWAESGTNDQSSIIVQISTDEGEHWLSVSNGDRISDKIRNSEVEMPSLSETIKYKIIANSTGGGGKPQVDWIQIGYGPGTTDYDYFLKVTPASAKVVINTTKTITVKVTRKEKEGESAPIGLIPKAKAAEQVGEEGEPVADQEVTAQFTSGNYGELKLTTAESEEVPKGGGTEPESEGVEQPQGEKGAVQGENDQQKGSNGTGGSVMPPGITGRTDQNGEFKFYYKAPSEYNLEDVIQVSTTPAGESEIKTEVTMVTVYPVNTVFTSDPAFVGHNKEVTFRGAITNHISVPVNNIAADVNLNQALTYIADSATINGREENVRVIMQDGTLRFECLGTEGGSAQKGVGGNEGEGESVRGRQIAIEGEGVGEQGSGVLQPDETLYLEFKAIAKVVGNEGSPRGEAGKEKGLGGSSNLYEAGLTLSYQEQESGRSYQNGEVTAQGTVASIWLQTLFGDIYAQGGFLAEVTPPSGNQNATYLVQTDGTISHFTSQAGNRYEIQNYIQGILSPVNVKRLMRDQVDQILSDKERFKVRELTPGLHQVSDLDKGRKEVVYIKGDLILETDQDFKSPLTVIVTGDLRIKDNTDYNNTPVDNIKKLPSLGLIVLGNTTIESDVVRGVGAIYTEGSLSTGSSDKQLVWEGLFVASGFNLDRTYFHTGDILEPAEKVIYDGRVVANPPTGFSELTDFPVWKEVAPK